MLGPMVYGCAYTAVSQKDAMAKRCASRPCCTLLLPAAPCCKVVACRHPAIIPYLRYLRSHAVHMHAPSRTPFHPIPLHNLVRAMTDIHYTPIFWRSVDTLEILTRKHPSCSVIRSTYCKGISSRVLTAP